MNIHCPVCKKLIRNTDDVLLDLVNTVIHLYCYTGDYDPITDKGKFKELVEKYAFLREVIH